MIGLLQRVTSARVDVDGTTIGRIDHGLLVFVCAEPLDTEQEAARLVERIRVLRVFADDAGKMNRSVVDVAGGLLLVPQFTLAADLRRGTRPGFSGAAAPELGRTMFDQVVRLARACHDPVATGQFGAHMQVSLVNDGPVTLWLRIDPSTADR